MGLGDGRRLGHRTVLRLAARGLGLQAGAGGRPPRTAGSGKGRTAGGGLRRGIRHDVRPGPGRIGGSTARSADSGGNRAGRGDKQRRHVLLLRHPRNARRTNRADGSAARPDQHQALPPVRRRHDSPRRAGPHPEHVLLLAVDAFSGAGAVQRQKAYLRQFTVCFAKEMHEHRIRVTAVCPAGVATDLYGLPPRWQRIGMRLGALISADRCARRGLHALWRGRRTCVPDWWNRIAIPVCKFLPLWLLRPIRKSTLKFQK